MKIYWEPQEKLELDLIRQQFSDAQIINPSNYDNFWDRKGYSSQEKMQECFQLLSECNLVVFSSIKGFIGRGVYEEIRKAENLSIPVKYIWNNNFTGYSIALYDPDDWQLRYAEVIARES